MNIKKFHLREVGAGELKIHHRNGGGKQFPWLHG